MAPVRRTAYGIAYYSYSLHDWRALRSLHDIPRDHWPILKRAATNFEWRNRIDHRDGAWPQLGGVDHIGAGFQDNNPTDLGAEQLTEYGLNPNNTRASWHGAVDSNTICLLAPGDTRPWVHGVANPGGHDLNSWGVGVEDGILSTNWDALPEPKRTAHLRMRAAFWALFFGTLKWDLKYTDTASGVWWHIANGRSWGLTQHGITDPNNRTDAGLVWRNGRRVNTFPYDELLPMIREEMAIRAGGGVTTPGLPQPSDVVLTFQRLVNQIGAWGVLDEDGILGPLTTTAAEAVQADLGVTVDGIPGPITNTALEDTVSLLTDLPAKILAAPFPSSPLTRAHFGDKTPATVGDALDHITRRVDQAWTYAHGARSRATQARDTAQATAERLTGIEAVVTQIAANVQGVDPEAIEQAIRDAVGRYEVTLQRIEDEPTEPVEG